MEKKPKSNENEKIKRKIEFWSKHQELDKHNIIKDTSSYLGHMSLLITVLFGLIGLGNVIILITGQHIPLYVVDILLFLLIIAIGTIHWGWKKRKKWNFVIGGHNLHFRAREKMIRYWYNKELGKEKGKQVTEILDEQCKDIRELLKKHYKKKISEKELDGRIDEIMKN